MFRNICRTKLGGGTNAPPVRVEQHAFWRGGVHTPPRLSGERYVGGGINYNAFVYYIYIFQHCHFKFRALRSLAAFERFLSRFHQHGRLVDHRRHHHGAGAWHVSIHHPPPIHRPPIHPFTQLTTSLRTCTPSAQSPTLFFGSSWPSPYSPSLPHSHPLAFVR